MAKKELESSAITLESLIEKEDRAKALKEESSDLQKRGYMSEEEDALIQRMAGWFC